MMCEKKNLKYSNRILKYRYVIGLVIFIILVLFKIHGSSIGEWQNFVTTNVEKNYKTNLFGKSRPIRSDEWNVQTPYFLAQSMSNDKFPVINKNITPSGQNMIISYNAPVKDISILAKPFNWGFLLLGKDYGLSWYWCMKIILLFLLSFEVCMIITKQNKMVSILGAFWITLSPSVQWWFMQHVGDLVFYMEAIIVTFYYIIKNFNRIKLKIIFSLLFSLSCVGFALVVYPALQIPLAYLCIAFMILIVTDYKYKIKFKFTDTIILIATVMVILLMLLHVIIISKEDIKILLSTSYPGKRISTGGDLTFYFINLYLTNIFLPYKDITFLNNCEVSSFINFLPVVILILPVLIDKKSRKFKIWNNVFMFYTYRNFLYVI
uniref:DUF7657 domain-containing protein n=1 Tax=Clostridium arbusti TaxID=1137848 RepID=UPI0002EC53AE|nr:hypothetical protein [Clostridium arbusti]